MGMTHEEAIKRLETCDECGDCLTCAEHDEAVQMAISALREQDATDTNVGHKWISVEERLPKAFVSVLVYMPEERPLPTVHEGFLAREGVWYANHFDRDPMEITHWMPLPEPPKEEV